ncbi:EAL domain-containing protein [Porcincola sp. LCP21S3_C12]|uniref:EAL domain-containing protein n=1 Tax=Porcincola sp. LCP21S3_C12 TaxID=3438798 RepID=UPI003F9AD9AC
MKVYEFSTDTRTLLENIPAPLAVYQYADDQIKPLLVSKAYLKFFGYSSAQEAVYGLGKDLYRNVHPDDIARMEQYSYSFATHQGDYDIVFRNKREDQSEYHLIHGTGRHIAVGDANIAFIMYTDETTDADHDQVARAVRNTLPDRQAASESAEFSKHYDSLTGLQNMTHFLDCAMAGIGKIWAKGKTPVILYFDLCNLKNYNIRFGLQSGDRQICALAELIGTYFDRDRVSRFESDHFVAYAENDQIESKLDALCSKMRKSGGGNNLEVKTGIFRFDHDGTRLTDACDRARLACESILRTSSSAYAWFDNSILESTALKCHIIRNFEKALENGWLVVYYQPIIRSMTGMVCNCEALVRWVDPEYGMISPGRFIPILEETGQIYKLDLYVFEQVCRDGAQMMKDGSSPIPVSVNLSRKDFLHDDLPDAIDRISRKYGVPREYTILEVTESAFVRNADKVDPYIRQFHRLGYRVWMDDFGSGYSSLGVLKKYSFDELKLDISFLQDFDEKSRQIVTSIVRMAKVLNLSTLAEGVETEEQYLFLKEIGCEKIQGYYFAKPMPLRELAPYCQRKGLTAEPSMWRTYLSRLSHIDYQTDKTLCVVDDDGIRMNILFANQAYREVLRRDHVRDLKDWERKINTPGDPIHLFHRQYADQQLRKLKGPQTTAYPSGDHYMQLTGSVEAVQDDHYLYVMQIQYVEINVIDFQQTRMETMSDLYYMCNDIAIYDLEQDTVQGVKSSLSDQPMGEGTELKDMSSVINAWKMNYCYLPDRERLAEFLDVSTMKSRLEQNENHALTGMFRSMTASGEYRWLLHIITPMQRSDFSKALHVTVNTGLQESDLKKIALSLTDGASEKTGTEMTGEVLWKNLAMNAERMYFWKDEKRRFVGASNRFLQYFGFQSEKELIGKTDEDVGWHINPDPFKKDEEEVLSSGKKLYLRNGSCIINGTNRYITTSKIPVYRDGKIIGLLGTIVDTEEAQRLFEKGNKCSSTDPVTGLANARGISDGVYSYLLERWRTGSDFAMIEVYVPEYGEVVKLYGDSSGDRLLAVIGTALKNCGGKSCVAGRVQESHFCMLMKFSRKEDVRNVARKIRTAIETVRKAGQWSGNCSAMIKVSYTDDFSRDRSSYLSVLSSTILNSRDCEEF